MWSFGLMASKDLSSTAHCFSPGLCSLYNSPYFTIPFFIPKQNQASNSVMCQGISLVNKKLHLSHLYTHIFLNHLDHLSFISNIFQKCSIPSDYVKSTAKSIRSVDFLTIFIGKMQDLPHSPLSTLDVPIK